MQTNVQGFLKEINKLFAPLATVSQIDAPEKAYEVFTFHVSFAGNRFFNNSSPLNVTNEYEEKVTELVQKHFKQKVHFNNTGTIFWVYLGK